MRHNSLHTLTVLLILGVFSLGTQAYALDFFPNTQNTTSPTISNFSNNLYFGMKNNDVARLQTFLISHNLLGTNLNTGYFGPSTFNALRRYQNAVGIPPTGFFGPLTRNALNSGKTLNTSIRGGSVATGTNSTVATSSSTPIATSTQPITLNLTSTFATDASVRINASFTPSSNDNFSINLRATCSTGVSVSQGFDVCNNTVIMPVIVGPGTYMSAFTFVNTSESARTVSFNAQAGPLVASTSIAVPSTIVTTSTVSTSTPPVTVMPTTSFAPTISQMVKQRGCELIRGTWSLSGLTGTCMFWPGADLNQTKLQEWSCTQWGGTYNSCLSSCSSGSATSTMCTSVCTPGCRDIK